MTRLRVGIDAREAFRCQPRGIGLYVRHLMREFASLETGHEFLLYHEREPPADLPPIPSCMRPVRVSLRGGRWHAFERLAMPWRMRRDGLSVYHGTYNTLPPRWPLWAGPPLVVSIHDLIVTWHDDDLDDPYVRYCRAVTRRVVRDAAVILTVSEWSRKDIIERLGVAPAKVRVFHNGLHPDFLAGAPQGAAEAARARFAGGRRYLLALGSALARKNTGPLIEALGLLSAQGQGEHLCLISGLSASAQKTFGERAARAGIAETVRFLPYLERADLIDLYAGADLSIYPSLLEGWGIPVLESLALGTPVLTSDSSGMREAGGAHAFFFDPTRIESMAQGIAEALAARSDWLAGTKEPAIARARDFTWRRAAEITLEAYRDVAS